MKVDPQKIWLLWPVVFVLTIIIATVLAIWTVITSMLLEPLGFASSVISMVSLLFVTVSLLLMFRLLHRLSDEQLPELESALGRLQVIEDRTKAAGLIGVEQKQVFHDRIDKHFSSVTLDAYKKLRGLEIDELSRINLFAGVNNSGKTTLLEAVYLLARQNDFDGFVEVIRRRGKVPQDLDRPGMAGGTDQRCLRSPTKRRFDPGL